MPNWCYTNIEFRGNDAGAFWEKMEELSKKGFDITKEKADFGPTWLGYYLIGAGIPENDVRHNTGLATGLSCRGSITEIPIISPQLVEIQTETAWSEMIEMWNYLIDKYRYDVSVHYFAEECGNAYYSASDKSMTDGAEYYIDSSICINDLSGKPANIRKIAEEFAESDMYSNDAIKDALTNIYGAIPIPLEKLIARLNDDIEDDDDIYISINKISFDDDSDVCAA